MTGLARGPLTIRLRLGLALALALLPVLALGAAQSVLAFRHDAREQRNNLLAAAERSIKRIINIRRKRGTHFLKIHKK